MTHWRHLALLLVALCVVQTQCFLFGDSRKTLKKLFKTTDDDNDSGEEKVDIFKPMSFKNLFSKLEEKEEKVKHKLDGEFEKIKEKKCDIEHQLEAFFSKKENLDKVKEKLEHKSEQQQQTHKKCAEKSEEPSYDKAKYDKYFQPPSPRNPCEDYYHELPDPRYGLDPMPGGPCRPGNMENYRIRYYD